MEVAVLSIIGIAVALLIVGVLVAASEREREMRSADKGDAYRLRAESTRMPEASSPPKQELK